MPPWYRAASLAIRGASAVIILATLVAHFRFGLDFTTAIGLALAAAVVALLPAFPRAIFEILDFLRYGDDDEQGNALNEPETPDERRARLDTGARERIALLFCHRVLSERIAAGGDSAWAWKHKDNIAVQIEAFLSEALPADVRDGAPPLSPDDEARLLADHPLLQPLPPLRRGAQLSDDAANRYRDRIRRLLTAETELDETD